MIINCLRCYSSYCMEHVWHSFENEQLIRIQMMLIITSFLILIHGGCVVCALASDTINLRLLIHTNQFDWWLVCVPTKKKRDAELVWQRKHQKKTRDVFASFLSTVIEAQCGDCSPLFTTKYMRQMFERSLVRREEKEYFRLATHTLAHRQKK